MSFALAASDYWRIMHFKNNRRILTEIQRLQRPRTTQHYQQAKEDFFEAAVRTQRNQI
jgi:hypothetical protein